MRQDLFAVGEGSPISDLMRVAPPAPHPMEAFADRMLRDVRPEQYDQSDSGRCWMAWMGRLGVAVPRAVPSHGSLCGCHDCLNYPATARKMGVSEETLENIYAASFFSLEEAARVLRNVR